MAQERKLPARRSVKPGQGSRPSAGKKRPVSKKKTRGEKKEAASEPRKKIPVGEYLLPFLIFGITAVVFLHFTGIIAIPFLDFLKMETKETIKVAETAPVIERTPGAENATPLFPGPDLERVEEFEGTELREVEAGFQEPIPTEDKEAQQLEQFPEVDEQETDPLPETNITDDPITLVIEPREEETVQVVESEEPEDNSEVFFRMSRIYTAMEPREAARILENIEQKEVVEILSMMKERDVARILSAMDVEMATEISKAMIGRR